MATTYVPYSGPLVTRKEAKAAGLPRYFTGKLCKHGHLSERYAKGACVACAADYAEAWQAANKAEFRAYQAKHYRENKAERLEYARGWRIANRDRFDAKAAEWQKANRQKINARSAAWKAANRTSYTAKRKLREQANKDHIAAERTRRRLANPVRWVCYRENRRARKLAAGGTHTPTQIKALAERQKHRCPNCGTSIRTKYEVDHIIALSRGGSNDISNIQLLCKPCNRSKQAKDPFVWAQEQGRLL